MKNIFKKGLVVLLASLFVTGVFASTTVTTEAGAAPVAQHEHVAKHVHCKKHCHTANGKKVCKKACKHHHKHAVKKTTATKAEPAATTTTTTTETSK